MVIINMFLKVLRISQHYGTEVALIWVVTIGMKSQTFISNKVCLAYTAVVGMGSTHLKPQFILATEVFFTNFAVESMCRFEVIAQL